MYSTRKIIWFAICFVLIYPEVFAQDIANKEVFIERKLRFKTRVFIASGETEYTAARDGESHAPFTKGLLQCLQNKGGADQLVFKRRLMDFLEIVEPPPRFGDFGSSEPGSDVILSVGGYKDGKITALVIGNSHYEAFDDLNNPAEDAKAVAEILEEVYDADVDLVIDITLANLMSKLRMYSKTTFDPRDQFFIYFAGHGQYDQTLGEGYLIMKDSEPNDDTRMSWIPQSTLVTILDHIPSEHVLVIMDGGSFLPSYR